MSSENAIEIMDLCKCYQIYERPSDRLKQMFVRRKKKLFREHWAVNNASLKIKRGETLGFIGRNGSGKSTILQMICGTLNPTSGTVKTNGKVAALLELGAGFNPEFSGKENIYTAAALYGLNKSQIDERYQSICEFSGIGDFVNQPVSTYSSGMFVRLAFSLIAHVDADILIIDEALSVGDAIFGQKCVRFLSKFRETGTLVFVSHDSASVLNLCDRCVWLDKGMIVMEGRANEVMQAYHAQNLIDIGNQIRRELSQDKGEPSKSIVAKNFNLDEINIISGFNASAESTGENKARIIGAGFFSAEGAPATLLKGGSETTLMSVIEFFQDLDSVIVGFSFKNKRGQIIFEENTSEFFRNRMPNGKQGDVIKFNFKFKVPLLLSGEYTIDLAVAEGTQDCHVQQQWIYDALVITIHTENPVYGILAVETNDISFQSI